MRRWIIIILCAITISLAIRTAYAFAVLHGPSFKQLREHYTYDAVAVIVGIWIVFWTFDFIRALEQQKRDRNPEKYSPPAAMTPSEPIPPRPATPFSVSAIRGSLMLSVVIIFFNVICTGDYFLACMFCSIWFFVALVRGGIVLVSPTVFWARLLIPIATGLLVYWNFVFQENISLANAAIIIQACERYQSDNGNYPKKLTDLVPSYLSSIPRAKYSLGPIDYDYIYIDSDDPCLMYWKQFGWPRFYDFRKRYWFGHSMAQ